MTSAALPKPLLNELAGMSDTRMLSRLPALLTSILAVDLAFVGTLEASGHLTVVALHSKAAQPASFAQTYPTENTPCALVLERGRFVEPEKCHELFAQLPVCPANRVQGYAGVALRNADGTACGVLAVISHKRMNRADRLLKTLDTLSARVATALAADRDRATDQAETNLLRSLLDAVPYPVFCKTPEGRYLECNLATEQVLGLSRQELLQKSAGEVVPGELLADCQDTERQIAAGEHATICHNGPLTLPDGEQRMYRFYKSALQLADPKSRAIACCFLDISEQQQAYARLEEKKHFLQSVIDNIVDPVMVVGLDKRVLLLNLQARETVTEEIAGRAVLLCRDVCRVTSALCRGGSEPCPVDRVLASGEILTLLQSHLTATGESELYETLASPYRDERQQVVGVILCSRNVSERVNLRTQLDEQEQRLHFLAYHDHLTQLPNRLNFQQELDRALTRNRREGSMCALMFINLDRFKVINDSLGHDIGDLVLTRVAEKLKKTIRESDTVARFGGDKFMILLEGTTDPSQASLIARKILNQFETSVKVRDLELFLTASIGICLSQQDGHDAESLIKNAEIAMYRGKTEGRNTYTFYNRAMDCLAHQRLEQESSLRKAIDNHEMRLHLQPQIDLTTRRICGFEALLRWEHPEKGLIFPEHFIQLAEETGMICGLGEWCIEECCRFIQRLDDQGMPDVRVAVNISPRHFRQQGLVNKIVDSLQTFDIRPERLELEITEGTLMEDVEVATSKMARLSRMGVILTIDDFGMGYSSLSYLKQFPMSKLKIDKSFVAELGDRQQDSSLVSAIIALAGSLDLEVLAEGVETDYQLERLRQLGCQQVQGFLFSKALPPDEALRFAANFRL